MHKARFCLIFSVFSVASIAGPLDSPVTPRPPTIGSEIDRGKDAATSCLNPRPFDLDYIGRCIDKAHDDNRQKMGQGFDAFDAGFYFTAWLDLQVMEDANNGVMMDKAAAQAMIGEFWTAYKSSRSRINITDADTVEALKLPPQIVNPKVAAAVSIYGD